MTSLGNHLTIFLREYLPSQREMSVQTADTYAYAFQLLVCFAAERMKTTPSALSIEQLDAPLVLLFLEHLEKECGNCARTRNSRLAAIKTFFRFLEYRLPTCLDQARRIRAIPVKKTDEVLIGYLNERRYRRCWTLRIRVRGTGCGTAPCSIWHSPAACESQSWLGCKQRIWSSILNPLCM
jgi:site-specific recombinase XerD